MNTDAAKPPGCTRCPHRSPRVAGLQLLAIIRLVQHIRDCDGAVAIPS